MWIFSGSKPLILESVGRTSGMEENVMNKFQKFKLKEKKEAGVNLSDEDIFTRKEECARSLISKIFGEKVVNYVGLKNTLTFLWANIGPVKIRKIRIYLYQFVFASQRDKLRILNGKAWTFDSQFII